MEFRMFACHVVETTGRTEWCLNDGESPEEVRDAIIAAGKSWNPPTYYTSVEVRELTDEEREALLDDDDGLDWHAAHNPPRLCSYCRTTNFRDSEFCSDECEQEARA